MEENKNKIIVIQNGSQNRNGNHLTFASYGKGIAKYKYWLLGITVCCTIAGFLESKFILNPRREVMTTNISLSLALNEKKTAYLDGSSFSYTDLISKDNINKVISENETFQNYDYETLKMNSAFSLQPKMVTVNNVETVSDTNYVLTTNPSAFHSEADARKFIAALIDCEEERAANAINSYNIESVLPADSTNFESYDFNTWITALNQQYSKIENLFSKMSELFTGTFSVDGQTLNTYHSIFSSYYTNQAFSGVMGELINNKYVNIGKGTDEEVQSKIDEYKNLSSSYQYQLNQILTTISVDQSQVDSLTAIKNPTDDISDLIVKYSAEIVVLSNQRDNIITEMNNIGYTVTITGNYATIMEDASTDTYLYKLNHADEEWKKNCVSFKEKLANLNAQMKKDNASVSALYRKTYLMSNKNVITVAESNMGTISGHISNFMVAGIALVISFLLASFIFGEIYINSTKKDPTIEEKKEEKAE